MVVQNRVAFLRNLLHHGAKLHASISSNPDTQIEKIKIWVDPAVRIDPLRQQCMTSILDMLDHACTHYHVADKGHKRSGGMSEVVFYISYGKVKQTEHSRQSALNASAEPFVPDAPPCASQTSYYEQYVLPSCGNAFFQDLYSKFQPCTVDDIAVQCRAGTKPASKKVRFADAGPEMATSCSDFVGESLTSLSHAASSSVGEMDTALSDLESKCMTNAWSALQDVMDEVVLCRVGQGLPQYFVKAFGAQLPTSLGLTALASFKGQLAAMVCELVEENILACNAIANLNERCKRWLRDRMFRYARERVDSLVSELVEGRRNG
eukprot:TRINITY_DN14527_c0_g1_i1.p1 TRINITY_DN14527_c0_g1~~TRINITY_DN14527_c0_g1_i1.p1  ORF type:complete len:321 (-),score=27.71 TRINITY_DN14527_c0_g1_i1:118-1080(-)